MDQSSSDKDVDVVVSEQLKSSADSNDRASPSGMMMFVVAVDKQ